MELTELRQTDDDSPRRNASTKQMDGAAVLEVLVQMAEAADAEQADGSDAGSASEWRKHNHETTNTESPRGVFREFEQIYPLSPGNQRRAT